MTDTAPAAPDTSVLLCWVGDITRIRAWLDAGRVTYDLSEWGRRGEWRVEIHQLIPGRFTPSLRARIGDRLYLDDGLLKVAKRTPRRRVPPPGAAPEPRGRARRDRSGGVR